MLEGAYIGERGASVTVQQNQMWFFDHANSVQFMHVLFIVDADVSVFKLLVQFQVGVL